MLNVLPKKPNRFVRKWGLVNHSNSKDALKHRASAKTIAILSRREAQVNFYWHLHPGWCSWIPYVSYPGGSYSLLQNVSTQGYLHLKETSFIKIKDLSQGIGFIINLLSSQRDVFAASSSKPSQCIHIPYKLMEIVMLLRATKISQFVPKEDISVGFSSFIFVNLCMMLIRASENLRKLAFDSFKIATEGNHPWTKRISTYVGFPGGSDGKEPAYNQETWVKFLGWEYPLEKGMANHSNILAWIKHWTLCGKERCLCISFAIIALLSISLRTQHQAVLQPSRSYLDFNCYLPHFWGHLPGVSIRTSDHTDWGLSPSRLPTPQLQTHFKGSFITCAFEWLAQTIRVNSFTLTHSSLFPLLQATKF